MTAVPVLHGRDAELRRLRDLVSAARSGAGGCVVLLGETGMGKTALLDALGREDVVPLGIRGVVAERSLPLAALDRLLPGLDLTGEPLRLRSRVLERLVGCAADRPVLCRVDDAQWVDPESLDVLGFVARRLSAHRVALVLAGRPELTLPAGAESLWLGPLPDEACERLLRDRPVPAGLRAALTDLAGGNPLDLVELAASLTPEQLAGRAPLPDELPAGPRRESFRVRLAALDRPALVLLLCAVAESTVELPLLSRLGPLDAVLDSGLLRVDGTALRLPSKAVRSTLYSLAPVSARRSAHALLARSLPGPRGVWHRAMAEPGSSAVLADELAAAPAASPLVAATQLERAAALTIHKGLRASRLLAAARQAWQAGRPGRARVLLSRAAGADEGEVALLHGEMELRDGEPAVATHELATAAAHLADPGQALLLAGEARRLSGDLRGYHALARSLPAAGELAEAHFHGLAATFEGRHGDAAPSLRRVVALAASGSGVAEAVWAAEAAFAAGLGERAYECASAAVSRARLSGRESLLPWALVHLALAAIVLDRHPAAQAAATEGLAAAAAAAQRNTWVEHLSLLGLSAALRGDRSALSTLDLAAPGIAERGLGRPCAIASWAHACLDLADDRPADALGRLEAMAAGVSGAQPAIQVLATPQLVEAAVLVEQPERARRALAVFDAWVYAGGADAWVALSHRCHALLGDDDTHFETAIVRHRRAGAAMELARTQLAYAHRLRRRRRARAAREQFREALRVFEPIGADRWAERARAGLRATGSQIDSAASLAGLTPQQTEISRLVAVGETNKEIARRLVISHRTVDHHLRNIFTTLGVRSRVELARRVAGLK